MRIGSGKSMTVDVETIPAGRTGGDVSTGGMKCKTKRASHCSAPCTTSTATVLHPIVTYNLCGGEDGASCGRGTRALPLSINYCGTSRECRTHASVTTLIGRGNSSRRGRKHNYQIEINDNITRYIVMKRKK